MDLPHLGDCNGTNGAAYFGCIILTSYLFLFIDFYFRTYRPAPKGAAAKAKLANGNGVHHKSS